MLLDTNLEPIICFLTQKLQNLVLTKMLEKNQLNCLLSLKSALVAPEIELKAEDLRLSARALGRIVGKIETDELLDVVFRDFCIGK